MKCRWAPATTVTPWGKDLHETGRALKEWNWKPDPINPLSRRKEVACEHKNLETPDLCFALSGLGTSDGNKPRAVPWAGLFWPFRPEPWDFPSLRHF